MKPEILFTVTFPDPYIRIESKRRYRADAPWATLWQGRPERDRLTLGVDEPEVMQRILDDLGAEYHRMTYCDGS